MRKKIEMILKRKNQKNLFPVFLENHEGPSPLYETLLVENLIHLKRSLNKLKASRISLFRNEEEIADTAVPASEETAQGAADLIDEGAACCRAPLCIIWYGFIASLTTAAFRLVIPYGFVITGFIVFHWSIIYGLAGAVAGFGIAQYEYPRVVNLAGLIGIIVGTIYYVTLSDSFYAAFIVSQFTFGLIQFMAPLVFALISLCVSDCIKKLILNDAIK